MKAIVKVSYKLEGAKSYEPETHTQFIIENEIMLDRNTLHLMALVVLEGEGIQFEALGTQVEYVEGMDRKLFLKEYQKNGCVQEHVSRTYDYGMVKEVVIEYEGVFYRGDVFTHWGGDTVETWVTGTPVIVFPHEVTKADYLTPEELDLRRK